MENNGTHGLVLIGLIKIFDDLGNVADTEQFMGVEELSLAIMRKIWGENAVSSALPTLVFTCSASLGGAVTMSCIINDVVHGKGCWYCMLLVLRARG